MDKSLWRECEYAYSFNVATVFVSRNVYNILACLVIVTLVLKNDIRICVYIVPLYKHINIRGIYIFIRDSCKIVCSFYLFV